MLLGKHTTSLLESRIHFSHQSNAWACNFVCQRTHIITMHLRRLFPFLKKVASANTTLKKVQSAHIELTLTSFFPLFFKQEAAMTCN